MDKTHKRIENAIKAGDIRTVRGILMEIVTDRPGRAASLDTVRYAIANAKGLFEPDTDPFYILPRQEWTQAYAADLAAATRRNFSLHNFEALVEVRTAMSRRPQDFLKAEADYAAKLVPQEPEPIDPADADDRECVVIIDDDVVTDLDEVAEECETAKNY